VVKIFSMARFFNLLKISAVYSIFICSIEYFLYFMLEGHLISFPLLWRNIANYLIFFTAISLLLSLPLFFTKIKSLYFSLGIFPATLFFLTGWYMDKYHAAYFFNHVFYRIAIALLILALIFAILLTYFEKVIIYLELVFILFVFAVIVSQRLIWNFRSPHAKQGNGVIVTLVDAMRADKLEEELTPNLLQFARESTYFANAHSAASCTIPSVFALMTGKLSYIYPEDRDAKNALKKEGTLADFFRKNGYVTIGISANRLVGPILGFDRGFQKFINIGLEWWTFSLYKPAYNVYFPLRKIKIFKYLNFVPFKVRDSAFFVNKEAISFIKKYRGKRFFLYLHYMDPHAPYSPPEFLLPRRKPSWNHLRPLLSIKMDRGFPVNTSAKLTPEIRYSLSTLYDAEIAYFDREFTKFSAIKKTGFLSEGTFVFLADHGEEFWEHGGLSHCHSLYEELIRVPLFIQSPLLKKEIYTGFVSSNILVNYFLKNRKLKEFKEIYSTTWHKKGTQNKRFQDMFSIIRYPRKIIGQWRKYKGKEWWVFDSYDLEKDPMEKNSLPVSDEEKKELKNLEKELKNKLKKVALKGSKKYLETLRALGYVR